MATEILMPALSPTMEQGTLAKWLVKEGDAVKSGDILAEIETDKATMEFEAVDEGVIGRLLVPAGTEGVKVNAPIATLLAEGEEAGEAPAPAPQAAAETEAPKAPAAAAPKAEAAPAPAAAPSPSRANGGRVFASPLARRIAAEKGIDLAALRGSGPDGRIVRADVEAAKPATPAPGPATTAAAPAPAPAAAEPAARPAAAAPPQGMTAEQVKLLYEGRAYDEIALDGMRKTIAARLAEAKQTIPHFYLRRSARLDALLELRTRLNATLAPRHVKLSVNDFIIKASALALQEVPAANAVWAGDRILQMKASDVGIAVAIEGGLFVPVIRDAETKSLSALSHEMRELGAKAKRRRLVPEDYQGGSFAISNLGMYGIEDFDAVINPPHGAILAVGAGIRQPVAEGDGVAIATVISMTLSCDHRVIDGALGAELLGAIVRHLENPLAMLA